MSAPLMAFRSDGVFSDFRELLTILNDSRLICVTSRVWNVWLVGRDKITLKCDLETACRSDLGL